MRPLRQIDSSILCGTSVIETIDADRRAYAAGQVRRLGIAPLRAFLIEVRGWNEAVAKVYSLLGNDGGVLLTRREALEAAYERGLLL